MSDALATLPWVEARTIKAANRRAEFGVNDKSSVSLEAIKAALSSKHRQGVRIIERP